MLQTLFLRFVHCSSLVEISIYFEYMGKRSLSIVQEVESISNKTVLYDTSCKHYPYFPREFIREINFLF